MKVSGAPVVFVGTTSSQVEPLPTQFNGSPARYCMLQGDGAAGRTHFGLGTVDDTIDVTLAPFVNSDGDPLVIACGKGSNDHILFICDATTSILLVTPVEL